MFLVQVVVAIGIVLATVLVAAGRGDGVSPAESSRRRLVLPAERPLELADLDAVRMGVGLRGYRMDEVDELLDRIKLELAERDERIAELEHLRRVAAISTSTHPGTERLAGPSAAQRVDG